MNVYTITPSDLLFFRDGRPMETGEGTGGQGANWPLPTVFFDALHAALHRAFPDSAGEATWEVRHTARVRNGRGNGRIGQLRFGNLRTIGPFPCKPGLGWLFPAPLDVRTGDDDFLHASRPLDRALGLSNLPGPLQRPVASAQAPSKQPVPGWWPADAIERYLSGEPVDPARLVDAPQLWITEWTTGIGTNPGRDAQDGTRIYSACYLRLRPGIGLGCAGTLPTKVRDCPEALSQLFPFNRHIICGGQQRVCSVVVEDRPLSAVLPKAPDITGNRVKFVLLSPSIFPASEAHAGGWLPSWVDAEGRVRLPRSKPPRNDGESRRGWRKRWQEDDPLDVRLVAAVVGKPVVVTGWSDQLRAIDGSPGTGKRTRLAAPAGSVYYFEGSDAPLLAPLLSWHGSDKDIPQVRSGVMGEKGLGLGVCAPWEPF